MRGSGHNARLRHIALAIGNVDREMMWRLALPGAVGAFSAPSSSPLPVHLAHPAVSVFLFMLGVTVLIRFAQA